MLVFSNYSIPKKGKFYKVVNPEIHCTIITVYSDAISLSERSKDILLSAKLPVKTKMPVSEVIASVGLMFYKEENKIMYSLPGKNCMKIMDVI